jgi:hypothetical protein
MAKPKPPEFPDIDELLHGIALIAEGVAKRHLKRFADTTAFKFKSMIEGQKFESFKENPLSAGWAIYKASHGLDPRVMIATKNYIESIAVFKTDKGFRIGFKEGQMVEAPDGSAKDISMEQLAQIQEAQRPHWTPFGEIMEGDAKKVAEDIAVDIKKEIPGRLNVVNKRAP